MSGIAHFLSKSQVRLFLNALQSVVPFRKLLDSFKAASRFTLCSSTEAALWHSYCYMTPKTRILKCRAAVMKPRKASKLLPEFSKRKSKTNKEESGQAFRQGLLVSFSLFKIKTSQKQRTPNPCPQ